jgi:hypothetical protein
MQDTWLLTTAEIQQLAKLLNQHLAAGSFSFNEQTGEFVHSMWRIPTVLVQAKNLKELIDGERT